MTPPRLVLLVWRPEPGAPTALAEALGTIRVTPEGASLLARQNALAADLHDSAGRYCGAVDASGAVVWAHGP
mgnify:CR=1 FL=1